LVFSFELSFPAASASAASGARRDPPVVMVMGDDAHTTSQKPRKPCGSVVSFRWYAV